MKRMLSVLAVLTALVLMVSIFALPAQAAVPATFAQEVLDAVNAERATAGLPALAAGNSALKSAAAERADAIGAMATPAHVPNDYTSVLANYGITYKTCGENFQWPESTAAAVVAAWMQDADFKANILNPDFTAAAVGATEGATAGNFATVMLFTEPAAPIGRVVRVFNFRAFFKTIGNALHSAWTWFLSFFGFARIWVTRV